LFRSTPPSTVPARASSRRGSPTPACTSTPPGRASRTSSTRSSRGCAAAAPTRGRARSRSSTSGPSSACSPPPASPRADRCTPPGDAMRSLQPLEAPVDPVDALRRVGFLLERTRQHSRRVEAFRGAVDVVRELAEGELATHVEGGTLTDLPGIGPSTAGVIAQAAAGELPDYLAAKQEEHGGPLVTGGETLTEAIIGDCQLHSGWSAGGGPIDEMALTAVEPGHEWMVLTDHSPRLRIATGLSAARLARQIDLPRRIAHTLGESITVLAGIEVDILDDGSLDQSEEMLDRLDL